MVVLKLIYNYPNISERAGKGEIGNILSQTPESCIELYWVSDKVRIDQKYLTISGGCGSDINYLVSKLKYDFRKTVLSEKPGYAILKYSYDIISFLSGFKDINDMRKKVGIKKKLRKEDIYKSVRYKFFKIGISDLSWIETTTDYIYENCNEISDIEDFIDVYEGLKIEDENLTKFIRFYNERTNDGKRLKYLLNNPFLLDSRELINLALDYIGASDSYMVRYYYDRLDYWTAVDLNYNIGRISGELKFIEEQKNRADLVDEIMSKFKVGSVIEKEIVVSRLEDEYRKLGIEKSLPVLAKDMEIVYVCEYTKDLVIIKQKI